MESVKKSVDIDCPASVVYQQWTRYEDFPRFMQGVREVRQVDSMHLHWRASVLGRIEEWDSIITEQVPARRISWKSTSGARNAGSVLFEPTGPSSTRMTLFMSYEPRGMVENAGSRLGAMSLQLGKSIENFRRFVQQRFRRTAQAAARQTASSSR